MAELEIETEKVLRLLKWTNNSKVMEDRFNNVVLDFEKFIHDSDIKKSPDEYYGIVENAIYHQNPYTTIVIANVIAGTKLALARIKVKYKGIDNRSWKKISLGSGKASKEDIINYAIKKWGDIFPELNWA